MELNDIHADFFPKQGLNCIITLYNLEKNLKLARQFPNCMFDDIVLMCAEFAIIISDSPYPYTPDFFWMVTLHIIPRTNKHLFAKKPQILENYMPRFAFLQ